jgi:hypothetical protein
MPSKFARSGMAMSVLIVLVAVVVIVVVAWPSGRSASGRLASAVTASQSVATTPPPTLPIDLPSAATSIVVQSQEVLNPASIPTTVLAATPADPACSSSLSAYGMTLTGSKDPTEALTGKTQDANAVATIAYANTPLGQLTANSFYRIYPAVITDPDRGVSLGVAQPITDRPMWVIEANGLRIPDRGVAAPPPGSSASPSATPVWTTRIEFIDPASGIMAFAISCGLSD